MERWLSGLRHPTRNRETSHGVRRFKSYSLRQIDFYHSEADVFEVVWQADVHKTEMSEKFETEQEALDSIADLEKNMRKMGGTWLVSPFQRKV